MENGTSNTQLTAMSRTDNDASPGKESGTTNWKNDTALLADDPLNHESAVYPRYGNYG